MQTIHQRCVLRFRVTDDDIIIGKQKAVGNLTLGAERLTGTRRTQNQAVGVFVKRNFLGAGKSYTIKGKQAEKKAENVLCGRLKCVLVAGSIKPLPTLGKRLRQG